MINTNVLVIDDDHALRKMLSYEIKHAGFKVTEAEDVKSALQILEREEIHVVLTDVHLPDGNGVELTQMIKVAYPLIEIIAITSEGRISDGVKAIKNGAFDYLVKGVDSERLILLITHAAEKAYLQNRISQLEKEVTGYAHETGKKDILSENLIQIKAATGIVKALHSQLRQRIMQLLFTRGRANVTEIYTELHLPQAIVSQHLLILKTAGLVRSRREDHKMFYSANYPGIEKVITLVQQMMPKPAK